MISEDTGWFYLCMRIFLLLMHPILGVQICNLSDILGHTLGKGVRKVTP